MQPEIIVVGGLSQVLFVGEGSFNSSLFFKISTKPSSAVEIHFSSNPVGQLRFEPSHLVFSRANEVAGINVIAVEDGAYNEGNHFASIIATSESMQLGYGNFEHTFDVEISEPLPNVIPPPRFAEARFSDSLTA